MIEYDDGRSLHRYPAVLFTRCKVTITHLTDFQRWTQSGRDSLEWVVSKKRWGFYNKEQEDIAEINFLCVGVIFVGQLTIRQGWLLRRKPKATTSWYSPNRKPRIPTIDGCFDLAGFRYLGTAEKIIGNDLRGNSNPNVSGLVNVTSRGNTPTTIGSGCVPAFLNPYPISDENLQFSLYVTWKSRFF